MRHWARRWIGSLSALAVLAVGMVLYAGTLGHPLVWDDHYYVAGQPFLRDCGNLRLVLNPRYLLWVLPVANSARPGWLASVLCDSWFYGDAWAGFRLTSILWHALGAALLMALVWELGLGRRTGLLAGLLFVAYPLHTEPVNLITFRADLMAFVFMALGLCLHLQARRSQEGRAVGLAAACLACYAAAMLSKEMAVTLPGLFLLADAVWPTPLPSRRRRWLFYGACLLLLGLFAAFRAPRSGYVLDAQESHTSWFRAPKAPEWGLIPEEKNPPAEMPWHRVYREPVVRLLTMSRVAGSYLSDLFWPLTPQGDYAPPVVDSWSDPQALLSGLAWAVLVVMAWRLRRRRPGLSFGLLWVPLTLLPVSGLIPLLNLKADRYLYIPSAGACLVAAAAIGEALEARRSWARACGWTLGLGLLALFCWRTVRRNRDYRDDLAFYLATEASDPGVPRNHLNLALTYQNLGLGPSSEAELQHTLKLWPDYALAHLLLAERQLATGRPREALTQLREGLGSTPADPRLHFDLGRAYAALGQDRQALAAYEEALARDPSLWQADLAAGQAQLRLGRPRQASEHLKQALRQTQWQNPEGLFHLALAYRRSRMPQEERRAYAALLRRSPRLAAAYRSGRQP